MYTPIRGAIPYIPLRFYDIVETGNVETVRYYLSFCSRNDEIGICMKGFLI